MNVHETRLEELKQANPLFNDRKLRLGTFCSNLSGGGTMADVDGVLKATWAESSALARMADEMEFEAIVPVGRWRGFGGQTDFNGSGFECCTFAAGIGAQTRYPALFSTSHVPTIHPVMAAKQATTIDHISGGRFALNLVTGWYKTEMEIFGSDMLSRDERYDLAAEWLEIVKALWESEEPLKYNGKYFNIREALLKPQPIQRPRPPVMCAGASSRGLNFALRHCDISFVSVSGMDRKASRIDELKATARREYGKEIQIWTNAFIFQDDTEAQARRRYQYVVHEKGDWEGVENLVGTMEMNSQSFPPDVLRKIKELFIAGWAGHPIIGTAEQAVDELRTLVEAGFDGVLLTWPSYVADMARFSGGNLAVAHSGRPSLEGAFRGMRH